MEKETGSVMLISFKKIDFVPSSLDVNVESLLRHIYIYIRGSAETYGILSEELAGMANVGPKIIIRQVKQKKKNCKELG